MKRMLAVILVFLLIVSLFGCTKSNTPAESNKPTETVADKDVSKETEKEDDKIEDK